MDAKSFISSIACLLKIHYNRNSANTHLSMGCTLFFVCEYMIVIVLFAYCIVLINVTITPSFFTLFQFHKIDVSQSRFDLLQLIHMPCCLFRFKVIWRNTMVVLCWARKKCIITRRSDLVAISKRVPLVKQHSIGKTNALRYCPVYLEGTPRCLYVLGRFFYPIC